MSLTSTQEEVLEEIIEAYENGKRLSDLPEATGTNPYDMYVEVLDEDGESKKAALANLLPYLEDEYAYGIEFDTSVSSPTCTRIGNSDLHASLPVQSRMRGCLLDDDGNVVEYLDPSDWTSNVRDGSRGQVMVEIPLHYRKFETDGTVRRVYISAYPLAGYDVVPLTYVSAYEAALDRTNSQLCSVVNTDDQYIGGDGSTSYDADDYTLCGKPATVISLTNFRKYARARGDVGLNSCGWNCMTYDAQKTLYWLFVVEYATLNTQATYNAELDDNGYHQGGLGAGVTTINGTFWNSWNGYRPFIPCGTTDELGNTTGTVDFDMPSGYLEAAGVDSLTVSVPRYRGVENPFGHIWQWTDGVLVEITPDDDDEEGTSACYVCSDPSAFSSTSYDSYSHIGNLPREDGYVTAVLFGEGGEIAPKTVGGGSTTYFCDFFYTSIPASTTIRSLLFGGYANHETYAGFVCAHSTHVPSDTHAYIGSRLVFLPE